MLEIEKLIIDELGLKPQVAFEIEFYLSGENKDKELLALFLAAAKKNAIDINRLEKESGDRQYEVSSNPDDAAAALENLNKIKTLLVECGKKMGVEVLFLAKPYENQPGCGLHINLSLLDKNGRNVFVKSGESEPEELLFSIGGLIKTMLEEFIFFAPNRESYKRFTCKKNVEAAEGKQYNNAPVNVSWGGNNRTTAIRIPESTLFPETRHIEHRVCGSDANPEDALCAVISGVYHGLRNKVMPPEKIYGNAFDKQYKLSAFPASLDEAMEFAVKPEGTGEFNG